MGHNVSARKLESLQAVQRSREAAGWVIGADGRVDRPQTPAAVLARGAVLEARCGRRPDCGRRVSFDAGMWCAAGHGLTPLGEILRCYACGLVPCALRWGDERYPSGPPLGIYLSDSGASVVVTCACGGLKPRRFAVLAFARQVVEHLGSAALAVPIPPAPLPEPLTVSPSLIRGSCPVCGERRWRILLFRSHHSAP